MSTAIAPPSEIWMELISPERLETKMARAGRPSARAVAKAAGWSSHTYMQRLLRGQAKSVKVMSAVRIAYFLGCGVDDLFVPKSSSEARDLAAIRAAQSQPRKSRRPSARRVIEEDHAA